MRPLDGSRGRRLRQADILVDEDTVVDIAPSIEADAHVINASDAIVIPGFCDPHIHSWEGALARLIPNNTTTAQEDSGVAYAEEHSHHTRSYFDVLHHQFAPLYQPEDVYIGTLFTMLTAISGGITTVCDNMHNTRSYDHSVAACRLLSTPAFVESTRTGSRPPGSTTGRFWRTRDGCATSISPLTTSSLRCGCTHSVATR